MRAARVWLLVLICLTCACRSTPSPTAPTTHPVVRHAWPMVHYDAARSGGSMALPFQEQPPAPPKSFALRGRLDRFNAPVVTRDDIVCIGSIGLTSSQPDAADGVTCFDPARQQERWFAHTDSDAYATSLGAEHLFVGTESGKLLALDLATGQIAWTHELPSPITASPLVLQTPSHIVAIADTQGHLHVLDAHRGTLLWKTRLEGGITSGLASTQNTLIAATTSGHVHALSLEDGTLRWRRQLDDLTEAHAETRSPRPVRIEAAPVLAEPHVIIAYMRDDAPGSTPPMLALDLHSGEIAWEATAKTPHHARWHNQHVSPVFVEDRLIFVEPYSKLFAAVSVETGEMLFLSSKPLCIHQQWSSLVHASDISYAPRHDGVLYTLSQQYGLSPWLVIAVDDSPRYFDTFKAASRTGDCLEDPPDHDGFLTTPAITTRGNIVLGRADGTVLYYAPTSAQ